MSFANLGLSQPVLQALAEKNYAQATPIQMQAIPTLLKGRDLLGIAQTGTGKTAAFVLPMITKLETGRARARMPRTLILEPTRELAAQVADHFAKYGAKHKLSVALLIGGVSFGDQDTKLTRGVDVLIATPGRLLDHTERGGLLLTGVELLVIDEADRMLDMGFIPDIERICKMIPFTRQTLFFTATMPPEIRRITETFLHNPEKIEVSRPATTAAGVAQFQVSVGREPHEKRDVLRQLLRGAGPQQRDYLLQSQAEVAVVYKLEKHGFGSAPPWRHGPVGPTAALDQFRKGEIPPGRSTSPPAAGYSGRQSHLQLRRSPSRRRLVHRIGRTGRAGRTGTAISMVTSLDHKSIAAIEKLIGQTIPKAEGDFTVSAEASSDQPRESRSRESGREGSRSREGSRGGRNKPRGEREPRHAKSPDREKGPDREKSAEREPRHAKGGSRHPAPAPQAAAEAFTPPAPPPASRVPSIGRAEPRRAAREVESEPADHSHLPAFLLRPVRARV